jgi:ATP-dependent Lhr-like helicase
MRESLQKDIRASQRLAHTWSAFFSRFGRLTEIQRQVIPLILEGKDILVCSPTASGKTEAVCAPILELNIQRREPWRILYLAPTRALVNDLYFRLFNPLSMLGYHIARYTGDHHDRIDDSRIIISTPESFDSMLCRGKQIDGNGHMLASVVAVVIDEIHLLYGRARGEQLRWLLYRLRRLRDYALKNGWTMTNDLQVIGLSATLPDPDKVKKYYFNFDGQVIIVTGRRVIETVLVECQHPGVEQALPAYIQNLNTSEKILVFCNSRKRVDSLASKLRTPIEDYGFAVRAHHGSLSKKVREEAEEKLRYLDRVVLFATSTLEIGIDIGDVDLVVLDGPAPDISSLLQRVGRGNRRTQKTRVMTCAGNMAEVIIHAAMIEAAREGNLGTSSNGLCHGVIVQQLASYIMQGPTRSRSRSALITFLEHCSPKVDAKPLLDHLIQQEEFHEDGSGIRLNETWRERSGRGDIHSNIEGTLGTTIVDMDTGERIASGIRYNTGNVLNVGGRLLSVRKWSDQKLEVRRVTGGTAPDANWSYITKAWVKGDGQPQAVRRYLGFSPNQWAVVEKSGNINIFHFGGGKRRATLDLIRENSNVNCGEIKINEWYIQLSKSYYSGKPDWITNTGIGKLQLAIYGKLDKLERDLARPQINKKLPMNLRYDEVSSWLDLTHELELYNNCEWIEVIDETTVGILCLLIENT